MKLGRHPVESGCSVAWCRAKVDVVVHDEMIYNAYSIRLVHYQDYPGAKQYVTESIFVNREAYEDARPYLGKTIERAVHMLEQAHLTEAELAPQAPYTAPSVYSSIYSAHTHTMSPTAYSSISGV